MNSIQELHIDFDLKLQQVMSKTKGIIKEQEKDWFLTQAQLDYVEARIAPATTPRGLDFEDTQQRLDDLQELIEYDYQAIPSIVDSKRVAVQLPFNYLHLIESKSGLYYNCGKNIVTSQTTLNNDKYIVAVEIIDFHSDNLQNFEIKLAPNGGGLVTKYSFANNYFKTSLSSSKEIFAIIDSIVQTINQDNDYSVYREYWNGFYYPNQLIFVADFDFDLQFASNGGTTDYDSVVESKTKYNSHSTVPRADFPNRIVKNKIEEILKFSYTSTIYNSPVSNIVKNILYVHNNNTFFIDLVILTYIRKPRNVDYFLNQSVEVTNAARKILDNAVQKVIALKQRGNYEHFVNENIYKQ